MSTEESVKRLQALFKSLMVSWSGDTRSWLDHITRNQRRGFADEQILVHNPVFPAFAKEFLDFTVGLDLAPELNLKTGRPDFTPADRVTHRFVFETKGSDDSLTFANHRSQIEAYLQNPQTSVVVLTNLVLLRVFELDSQGRVEQTLSVDLRGLATTPLQTAVTLPDAARLEQFVERFSRRELTPQQKLDRIRQTPPWDPASELTDPEWISARVEMVVSHLTIDVHSTLKAGALTDPALVSEEELAAATNELRGLLVRLSVDPDKAAKMDAAAFVAASDTTEAGLALRQFAAHVAYWMTTKLLLVRVWEDLGLIDPASLYDGGFDQRMSQFDDSLAEVVRFAFGRAEERYRALFTARHAFSWYEPSGPALSEALYELGTTYLGEVRSDVLGEVYERTLERLDRKLLGQYYTPRDIIGLIWDLVLTDDLLKEPAREDRALNVLDIATGSGGFLVEGLTRLRDQLQARVEQGESVDRQLWINQMVAGFNGIEFQRFSAFLAELNLLIQFSQTLSVDERLRIPELGIVPADTLALHNPKTLTDQEAEILDDALDEVQERRLRAARIKNPEKHNSWMDVAVGNPPYIGEKIGSKLWRLARERYPYWEDFAAPHVDYLYPFLIVGISKLRPGGRFGFITTEYWLRAAGARPLRTYLAHTCRVDRIILFRDMRLFPDAQGQHSLVVVGQKIRHDSEDLSEPLDVAAPLVTIYDGPNLSKEERAPIVERIRTTSTGGSSRNLRSFKARVLPAELGSASWAEVLLSKPELDALRKVQRRPQLGRPLISEGVIATFNKLPQDADQHLPAPTLNSVGWPDSSCGVYSLTTDEVAQLGDLSEPEQEAIRPIINTADVFPYAAVLPDSARSLLYLPKPSEITSATTVGEARGWQMPDGMEHIEGHLKRFRPILDSKLEAWNEKRPWWSLHRARAEIVDTEPDGDWADYCVTTRWGGGGSLVVGLAPSRSVPASSLHAIRVDTDDHNAAYLAALYNSTMFQDLATAIPPGHLRAADLESLGLPDLGPEIRVQLAERAEQQAELVTSMVSELSLRFPRLPEVLRSDISLSQDDASEAWLPDLPKQGVVPLNKARWFESAERIGSQAGRVLTASTDRDMFGPTVVARAVDAPDAPRLVITLGASCPDAAARALAAYIRGAGATGSKLNSLLKLPVPVDVLQLAKHHDEDLSSLALSVNAYRTRRDSIDTLIENV